MGGNTDIPNRGDAEKHMVEGDSLEETSEVVMKW
jgi:hypothetical protein